jgi:cobalt-precorrin 5A hydrolase
MNGQVFAAGSAPASAAHSGGREQDGGPSPTGRWLTVGVGASRGVGAEEVLALVRRVLDEGGLTPDAVRELATVDAKAGEPGLLAAADRLEVPLRTYPADVLAAVEVPTPSDVTRTAVATPSVAEAAALVSSGAGGRLLVRKTSSAPPAGGPAMATAAVATAVMPSAVGAALTAPAGTRRADAAAREEGRWADGPVPAAEPSPLAGAFSSRPGPAGPSSGTATRPGGHGR